MRSMIKKFAGARGRFAKADEGNVAIIFGMMLLPMISFAGVSIDYSRAVAIRARFNQAADSAALSGVIERMKNNNLPISDDRVKAFFMGSLDHATLGITPAITVSNSLALGAAKVTVSYRATVPMAFTSLLGVNSVSIGGSATSAMSVPKYAVFNFLLDNSPSMGIGASAADIAKLQSVTPDQCAFACHQHTFDAQGRITGNATNDYYTIAKNNGVQTRIDVLRSSVQSIAQQASTMPQLPNQFKMAIYSFSDTFQTITGPTINLATGPTSASALAGNIDLAFAYNDQRDTQTSFDTALTSVNQAISTGGDGLTANAPLQYLLMVTDGMQDEPTRTASGTGDPADPIAPLSTFIPPAVQSSGNVANNANGNATPTRLISALDPALCTTLKNRNIQIAVLYTPYLPITNNAYYNTWAAPVVPQIPVKLQACATTGLYFEVSPGQSIGDAMTKMFTSTLSQARLVN